VGFQWPFVEIDEVCPPAEAQLGGWFLHPFHHLIEGIILTIVLSWMIARSLRTEPTISLPARKIRTADGVIIGGQRSLQDRVLFIVLIISYGFIFWHKWEIDRVGYLLQPCHLLHLFLICLNCLPPQKLPLPSPSVATITFRKENQNNHDNHNSITEHQHKHKHEYPMSIATYLFNIYLHLIFGTLLGLVAADLSIYTQFFELENWFIQHFLLTLLPLYYIGIGRYDILSGWGIFLLSYGSLFLAHVIIFVPASLLTGLNVNFVMCPPTSLEQFGSAYRIVMLGVSFGLMAVIRYGVLQPYVWLCRSCCRRPTPTDDHHKVS
jgi:hypothetical protein